MHEFDRLARSKPPTNTWRPVAGNLRAEIFLLRGVVQSTRSDGRAKRIRPKRCVIAFKQLIDAEKRAGGVCRTTTIVERLRRGPVSTIAKAHRPRKYREAMADTVVGAATGARKQSFGRRGIVTPK